jgi:hypothetical protein
MLACFQRKEIRIPSSPLSVLEENETTVSDPNSPFGLRANTRCKMEHPAGEKSLRRASSVYSVAAAWYSAPIYTAPVGDALIVR